MGAIDKKTVRSRPSSKSPRPQAPPWAFFRKLNKRPKREEKNGRPRDDLDFLFFDFLSVFLLRGHLVSARQQTAVFVRQRRRRVTPRPDARTKKEQRAGCEGKKSALL
jgi:hypothetical protein